MGHSICGLSSKNVQLLISLLVFLTTKPLTIKGWSRRRSRCPMGSSLPNHDAKVGIGQTEERQEKTRKTQGQTALDTVSAKKIQKITIYMMHEQY